MEYTYENAIEEKEENEEKDYVEGYEEKRRERVRMALFLVYGIPLFILAFIILRHALLR